MRTLLLDAGGAEENDNYLVPAFHADASENPVQCWNYFVRHYADEQQQRRDTKLVPDRGVLYPRAGTVGGCTAHHALITVYPYNRDWDAIAEETGDATWHSTAMRRYFERLERCTYRPRPKEPADNPLLAALLRALPLVSGRYRNEARHGFDGWLPTALADPRLAVQDEQLLKVLLSAAEDSLAGFLGRPLSPLEGLGSFADPNDWRVQTQALQGLWQIPVSTADGRRSAVRERVQAVQRDHPDQLVVHTHALAARIVLDEGNTATGVDYLDAAHAYRADPATRPASDPPVLRRVVAAREVILAAGTFNTPQLLMPRVVHLPDGTPRRSLGGGRQRLPGPRGGPPADRRRLGLPPHSRVLRRRAHLHDQREGERRDPRRRGPHLTSYADLTAHSARFPRERTGATQGVSR
ncbi:GMC family oxidoreductase N-terminal domain-containing protein [Streptomyces collinus]|uniref:GMC family oxidoreductase N-terminal domain-containing protein n=1 Tax=Streptomyces collinus TaxID=42684 RepID=UPI003F541550